jgi:hypothetical protein
VHGYLQAIQLHPVGDQAVHGGRHGERDQRQSGPRRTAGLTDSDLRRMAELVRRYVGRHLGGTGASVIAVCEWLAIVTVATVSLRDLLPSGRQQQ